MDLTDGLEAFWKCDGDLLDSQGSHDGTGSAQVVFRPGPDGLAAAPSNLNTDGSEASVSIAPIVLDAEWTIAIRVVPRENWDGQHKLFSEIATGRGLYLDDNSGNRGLGFWDGTNDWVVPGALGLPAVHHVVARFVLDGAELHLFVNGVFVLGESIGPGGPGVLAVDRVAFDGFGWSLLLADNAAIYTRALSDEEIVALASWEGPGGGDVAASVIEVSPADGTPIGRSTPLNVTITDASALLQCLVLVRFPNGSEEFVTDLERWATKYSGSSSTPTEGGVVLTLRRTGGWPDAPTVTVYAVDANGNEV